MTRFKTKHGTAYLGDCLEVMKSLEDNSIDTLITDPPAGIGFMGKEWDKSKGGRQNWVEWAALRFKETLRVIKPGGLALVWALPKTAHWTATALEDAGWRIKTKIYFLFGGGFPKALDVSKAIDKAAGAIREKIENPLKNKQTGHTDTPSMGNKKQVKFIEPNPTTPKAQEWNGWKSELKPACEEWIIAEKPIEKNYAHNAITWGVAGFNVNGCRIDLCGEIPPTGSGGKSLGATWSMKGNDGNVTSEKGRYPSNVLMDDWFAEHLDNIIGIKTSGRKIGGRPGGAHFNQKNMTTRIQDNYESSSGGPSRFFQRVHYWYGSKAGNEKHEGLEDFENAMMPGFNSSTRNYDGKKHDKSIVKNTHPTVKSLDLMRYLCRLSRTPKGGTVLDIFGGTMTTAIAAYFEFREFIIIEKEREYFDIGVARLKAVMEQRRLFDD